jgi:hypothetical protein
MASNKGKKIDTVTEKQSGISVDIYLHKDSMKFSASYGSYSIYDPDGDKVRTEILAEIRKRAELIWTPVIQVNQDGYGSNTREPEYNSPDWIPEEIEEKLNLEVERFYVARKADGRWVYAAWHLPPQERMQSARDWYIYTGEKLVFTSEQNLSSSMGYRTQYNNRGRTLIPYSDETWDGLIIILRRVSEIREALRKLLISESAPVLLQALGNAMLLPSGGFSEIPAIVSGSNGDE